MVKKSLFTAVLGFSLLQSVLLFTPLVAVGAVLLGEALVVRTVTVRDVPGKLYRDSTGPVVATVLGSERGAPRWNFTNATCAVSNLGQRSWKNRSAILGGTCTIPCGARVNFMLQEV